MADSDTWWGVGKVAVAGGLVGVASVVTAGVTTASVINLTRKCWRDCFHLRVCVYFYLDNSKIFCNIVLKLGRCTRHMSGFS